MTLNSLSQNGNHLNGNGNSKWKFIVLAVLLFKSNTQKNR